MMRRCFLVSVAVYAILLGKALFMPAEDYELSSSQPAHASTQLPPSAPSPSVIRDRHSKKHDVMLKNDDTASTPAYVLVSFKDLTALGDGLRLLVSDDGLSWSALPGEPLLLPLASIEGARVFRDPSVAWHDGWFHLVFTSDLCVDQVPGKWVCRRHGKPPRPVARFGYARSRDLVHWEAVRLVEAPIEDACSLWAPEVSVLPSEGDEPARLLVMFTATQAADLCPSQMRESVHRPFYMFGRPETGEELDTSTIRWSAPMPMAIGNGGSMIDLHAMRLPRQHESDHDDDHDDGGMRAQHGAPVAAHLSQGASRYLLIYKAEASRCGKGYSTPFEWTVGADYRNSSCALVLRQAVAEHPTGPWVDDPHAVGAFFPHAISRPCVEGPSMLQAADGGWLVLFDAYRTDCTLLVPGDTRGCGTVGGFPAAAANLHAVAGRSTKNSCGYQTKRRGFGALRSADLAVWYDVSGSVFSPADYKHGTAIKLPQRARTTMCELAGRSGALAPLCRGGVLSPRTKH